MICSGQKINRNKIIIIIKLNNMSSFNAGINGKDWNLEKKKKLKMSHHWKV